MFRFIRRNRRVLLFAGIGFFVLVLIFSFTPVPAPGFVTRGALRVTSPLMRAHTGVRGWFARLGDANAAAEVNRRLSLENEMLRLENSRLLMQAEEMDAMYALLDMQSRYVMLPSVGARIVGRSFGSGGFHIDRGSESGIYENMAVFAGGGLAGVVRHVNHRHSVVVSIMDGRFAAAGMCTRTGAFGVVWGGDGLLRMEHIDLDSEIAEGDKIVTSYYSSIFPRGLSIGVVESVHLAIDGLSRYAFVVPAADFTGIEMVLVITELNTEEGE